MRLLILLCTLLLLTGCAGDRVRSTPTAATIIEKPTAYYVPIPEALRARCPWPKSGKPSESIDIARQRRECLERYERQFDGIDKVQGQPVPEKSQ